MSRTRIFSAIALAVALAACGEAGRDPIGPDGPRLDSGPIAGGNRSGSDSTATVTSSTAPSDSSDTEFSGPIAGGN